MLLVLDRGDRRARPALGLSQRAARRPVAGYALLDADCPDAGALPVDWPDAPVHYLASPAAPGPALDHARLRAWRCTVADLDAASRRQRCRRRRRHCATRARGSPPDRRERLVRSSP